MKAFIITPCLTSKINDTVNIGKDDIVICADNSFKKALAENVKIDLIMGDFDTGERVAFPENVEVMQYPSEKDDTDTMLCVKEAARRGISKIVIVGGLSGRLDHTFANIQTLAYGVEHELDITISDGENEAFMLRPGRYDISKKEGFSLSVFSYSEKAEGICESGVKYPTDNVELTNSFPLGVSNEILSPSAEISFTKGLLLIILSKWN